MSWSKRVLAAGGLVVAALLMGCDGGGMGMGMGGMGHQPAPATFRSNGQRIFFTGTSASGRPITFEGGDMRVQMHGGGCATCHGADGRGGFRGMPYFWVVSPDIRGRTLLGNGHDDEKTDNHGDHEKYTEKTLARAIQEGIDPSGKSLHPTMPRWSMNPADLRDLIAYLRRL